MNIPSIPIGLGILGAPVATPTVKNLQDTLRRISETNNPALGLPNPKMRPNNADGRADKTTVITLVYTVKKLGPHVPVIKDILKIPGISFIWDLLGILDKIPGVSLKTVMSRAWDNLDVDPPFGFGMSTADATKFRADAIEWVGSNATAINISLNAALLIAAKTAPSAPKSEREKYLQFITREVGPAPGTMTIAPIPRPPGTPGAYPDGTVAIRDPTRNLFRLLVPIEKV